MPCDWIGFRRELAFPKSVYRQAGGFSGLLTQLNWAEKKAWDVKLIE
jgi:hypothetical protein